MVVVKKNHNTVNQDGSPKYISTQAWSDETRVQWGQQGIVLSTPKSYLTAFFEAFPPSSDKIGGFIRGEGDTIEDAEAAAFKKYIKYKACTQHEWGRRTYTNSLGTCKKCGTRKSGVFKTIYIMGKHDEQWNRPWDDMDTFGHYDMFEDPSWNEASRYIGDLYYGAIRKGIPDKDSYLRKKYLRWKLYCKDKDKYRKRFKKTS